MGLWIAFVDLIYTSLLGLAMLFGGNMGLAIGVLSLSFRLALLPLTLRMAYRSFCYAFADNFKAIKYLRLDTPDVSGQALLDKIKTYLAAGLPSMFGFPVYEEFMHAPANAHVAYPAPKSKYYRGHAIVAAGYDDNLEISPNEKGALLIRNSWGKSWGSGGYVWLSYKYFTKGLALDWWTLISENWVDTGNFV